MYKRSVQKFFGSAFPRPAGGRAGWPFTDQNPVWNEFKTENVSEKIRPESAFEGSPEHQEFPSIFSHLSRK